MASEAVQASHFKLGNVDLGRPCGAMQPFLCPCCGACLSSWIQSSWGQLMCPYCKSVDRHHAACLAFIREPPARLLRTDKPAFVAYFGPHLGHAAALRNATPRLYLQEFDFFAPGYHYARTTVAADVQSIPLQNSSLDGIIILHVLEHVLNLQTALQQLHRVLRPGGFLHHDTPCYHSSVLTRMSHAEHTWVRGKRGEIEDCATARTEHSTMGYLCKQSDHLWGYSCAYLSRRLRANGFLCDITPSNVTLAEAARFVAAGTELMHISPKPGALAGRLRCRLR
jgi:hypothetical protein